MSDFLSVPLRILFITVLVVASLLSTASSRAYGNGKVIKYERHIDGPYEISFGTIPASPVIGNLHMSISVSLVETGALPQNIDIKITGKGPDREDIEIGPIAATQSFTEPSYHEVNIIVDRTGIWLFTVYVKGDQGAAKGVFDINVEKVNVLPGILTMLLLLVLLTILGFSLRSMFATKNKDT